MWMQVLVIVLTSLLSSVLTLAMAWLVFDRYLKALMWKEIDGTAADLGLRFKQQVADGVREGISSGLSDLRTKAAKSAARGGLDILEENLNLIFRNVRRRD